jgi:hypothetical protein
MSALTNPLTAANGWHEMRTAEGRTVLTQGGVVPGRGKGGSISSNLHDDGSQQRVVRWLEADQGWSLTQFDGKRIVAHIFHKGLLADAEQMLLDAL